MSQPSDRHSGIVNPSVTVTPEIRTPDQVLAALSSTGAGFEGAGGSAHMLTEAVENSVDSIIQARRVGLQTSGTIRLVIDRVGETVSVVDNGAGFLNPIHIAQKPFDSLKKYDPELTGKFARGIQGFRAFCGKLTFLTRRASVPAGESLPGTIGTGRCVRIAFDAQRIEVELQHVADEEFPARAKGLFTGAVAIYSDWKPGEFGRLRTDLLQKRLQHHFGELVRTGEIGIELMDGRDSVKVEPRDFSAFEPLGIAPVPVSDSSGTGIGEIVPELYLTQYRKRDQWMLPFLMFRNRPVGDRPICEIEELADAVSWGSPYVTGFVRCDFCEINELRLALKAGAARQALYRYLSGLDAFLTEKLRRHSRTLFDSRMREQINQLVVDLQDFLRRKGVFDFRNTRSLGSLGIGEKVESLNAPGSGAVGPTLATSGEAGTVFEPTVVEPTIVQPAANGAGDSMAAQSEVGGVGRGGAEQLVGGPSVPGSATTSETGPAGFVGDPGGLAKMQEAPAILSDDHMDPGVKRRARRQRPRGFQLVLQDDEFNEDLSWFDPSTATIVINSGHERYRTREGEELAKVKSLMDYLAELYMWEISKIRTRQEGRPPEDAQDLFLKTKFEFFEERGAA